MGRGPGGRKQRAPFVLLVVGLLCGGLVSLLLLNTVLAQGSIQETTLRGEIDRAKMATAEAERAKLLGGQPDAVADAAEKQGMHLDNTLTPLRGTVEKAVPVR